MRNRAEWTFMVYMAGDNDLSAAGDRDLEEMRQIGSSDAVNVVVEFDNAGDQGTRRFHIKESTEGADADVVEQLGETDCGAPNVLLEFIRWAAERFPARRYALVLWNHGSGWEPQEIDRVARSVRAFGYSEREIAERSASRLSRSFFRTSLERMLSLPHPSLRAICSDDGSGHSLDTLELGQVLAAGARTLGQPFDLLGLDACLMSNLEVAYQVRQHVRYMVGSEETEPADGWPYHRILQPLLRRPQMATAELAATIVDEYLSSYEHESVDVTQAALDTAAFDPVLSAVDQLASVLTQSMVEVFTDLWRAQRSSARFYNNTLWDLSHLCHNLAARVSQEPARDAAAAVVQALQPRPDGFVIAEGHHGAKVDDCGGVTAYLVPPITGISRFYSELAWAREHRWLEMLRAYHAA